MERFSVTYSLIWYSAIRVTNPYTSCLFPADKIINYPINILNVIKTNVFGCTVRYQTISALNSRTCSRAAEIHLSLWLQVKFYIFQPFKTKISPELHISIQSVPRSKHTFPVIKTSRLMLYREIMVVCSEIHTKHINTVCGQNVELLNVKPGGTYSNHWALKGQ